ncbi:acyltransferase family protein [Bacteroides caecimuris]|uniref:acyltransferase family protein n=1 Tax=Bacteroides caecimuris TaxID=1796613 RepID=UPI0026478EBD|nr:acyltransferase family protein [Bacteroides caecimuris]
MNNSIKRIEWVDIARGIAIISMVAGHSAIPATLSKYIWSFHMPLFFIVSGLFFKAPQTISFKALFIKRIFTLLIPYCFFTVIVMCGYIGTEYFKPYELYEGWEGYALWFVPVLFFAELLFYFIAKLKKPKLIICVCVLTCLGKILSIYSIRIPFKIDVVPFAVFFIASGYIARKYIFKYKPKAWLTLICGIITIVLSQILPKLGMGKNEFGIMIPNLLNALLGIFFIFSISMYLAEISKNIVIRFVDYFGRNSLFVMAFSQVFNYWILTWLDKCHFPKIIALPLRYAILFGAIFIVAEMMMKHIPILVGKKLPKTLSHGKK